MIALILLGILVLVFAYLYASPSDGTGGASVLSNWTEVIIAGVAVILIIGCAWWFEHRKKKD